MKERRFLAEILSASSGATTAASPRCISRPATCRRAIRSTISRRRCAPSASRSTTGAADEISMAKLLTLLFEVTACSTWRRGPSSSCCRRRWWWSRASARMLDPSLDMWATAEPVVRELDRAPARPGRHGSRRRAAALRTLAAVVADLPRAGAARRAAASPSSSGLPTRGSRSRAESVEDIGRAEARRARWRRSGALGDRARGSRRAAARRLKQPS